MTDRQTIIEILIATRGISEGQTADAILSALTAPRVPEGFAIIPLDPRNGQPQITNDMVGKHCGAHTFLTTATDEDGEEISVRVDVPWDTCKGIYKEMAKTAILAAAPAPADELATLRERLRELEGDKMRAHNREVSARLRGGSDE